MFIERRKKKNYRTYIYAAVIALLCLTIVVIAWPQNTGTVAAEGNSLATAENEKNKTEENDETDDNTDTDVYNPGDFIGRFGENSDRTDEEKTDIAETSATYYLVRRDGSEIKVYFIDESGNPIELETTEIIYDVLAAEDQKLFDEGFRVNTQEELAVLLQDFES